MGKADIGLTGLAVMGQNLVLNMERNGYTVAVHNRTTKTMRDFVAAHPGKKLVACESLKDFVDALTREYLQTVNAEPGWNAVLDRYNVQWVIVPPWRALAAQLDASPYWTRRYEDGTAGVWVRR